MNRPPLLIIIDSIQTMYSTTSTGSSGSVTQIRECTAKFVNYAKSTGIQLYNNLYNSKINIILSEYNI